MPDPKTAPRLAVIGIRPAGDTDDSVRPAGIHLRWMFPNRLGFPPDGFGVYRRDAKRPGPVCETFAGIKKGDPLPAEARIAGAALFVHEAVQLLSTGDGGLAVESATLPGSTEPEMLRLRFDAPVVSVAVSYAAPTSVVILRAEDEDERVVATATGNIEAAADGQHWLAVEAAGIRTARLVLGFGQLRAVCALSEAAYCAADWEQIAELPVGLMPPGMQVHDLLKERLGDDVRNHYVRDLKEAETRYGPRLPGLLDEVHRIANGEPDPVVRASEGPLAAIRPQAMVLLAALDANVARLLSLGWVDRFNGGPRAPEPGRPYDYKVEARWRDGMLCGLALDVGSVTAPRPRMGVQAPAVAATVEAGVRWNGMQPLHRVGLRWGRPPSSTPIESAVRPVLYDVARRRVDSGAPDAFTALTRRPVVVSTASWEQPDVPMFLDSEVEPGEFKYAVRGVDLFGQTSPAIGGSVTVADTTGPPPPVAVTATLVQPGYPWLTDADRAVASSPARLEVRFRYGPFQRRQAPDATKVRLYWREGSLADTRAVTVDQVTEQPAGPNRRRHVVRVPGVTDEVLARFASGLLLPWAGDAPPAAARLRARIEVAPGGGRLHLAPSAIGLTNGHACTLVSDPRNPETWIETGIERSLPAAIEGTMVGAAADGRTFPCSVVDVAEGPRPARLPAQVAAEVPPDMVAAVPEALVRIDRAVLEPDAFAGSQATGPAGPFAVAGSAASHKSAVLELAADDAAGLAPGDAVALTLGATGRTASVRYVEVVIAGAGPVASTPAGGQLAWGVATPERQTLVTADVVSDVRQNSAGLGMLVRFPEGLPQSTWPRADAPVTYHPPDAIADLAVGLVPGDHAGALGPFQLPLPATVASASGYLALTAVDVRGNEGPLSAPVQVIAVRPPPANGPSAPFPCGAPSAAWGLASPPDAAGRATVCLAWEYTPPSADAATVRFQVARAMDATLVAIDRRNWLEGRAPAGLPAAQLRVTATATGTDPATTRVTATPQLDAADFFHPDAAFAGGLLTQNGAAFDVLAPVTRTGGALVFDVRHTEGPAPTAGPAELHALPVVPASPARFELRLHQVVPDAARGLVRAVLRSAADAVIADGAVARILEGGRLIQGANRFEITRARVEGELTALLRPIGDASAVGGGCVVEPAPDYRRVTGTPPKLRLLADKLTNEDAFGLVTGIPVDEATLVDDLRGVGRNAFFYRVRAVDAANNHSAWSPASVPFWQLDTTPPEPPRAFRAVAGPRSVELRWEAPADPEVTTWNVYRLAEPTAPFDAAVQAPITVPMAATEPLRPTVVGGGVAFTRPVRGVDANQVVVRRLVGGAPTGPNLFVRTGDVTRVLARRVEGLNPLAPDGVPVAVSIGDPAAPTALTHRPGSGEVLRLARGRVDLTFGLTLTALEAVVAAERLRPGSDLAGLLSMPMPEALHDAPRDLTRREISGLGGLFADGTPVAMIVRLDDGSLRAIRTAPGRADPLTVEGGSVRIDLEIADGSLLAVESVAELDPISLSSGLPVGTDLDLLTHSTLQVESGAPDTTLGITELNPLVRDGTPVAINLVAAGAAVTIDGDPRTRTWRDTAVEGSLTSHYWLAALRTIGPEEAPASAGTVPTPGSVAGRMVRSIPAGPVAARPLNREA